MPRRLGTARELTYDRPVVDAREWLDALARAWRAEREAVRARIALERSGRSLSERVARGIALHHLRIVDEQSAPGDRVRVRVAVPDAIDLDNLRLAPGDPVRLWAEHPDESGAVRGVYERREDQALWLMLDRSLDEIDRDYALDPEAPEVTFDRGDQAIARARAALATSDLARIRDAAALVKPPRPIAPVTWTALDAALDDRQRAAVDAALRSGDVALIHGPPGTGKTRTLVEVVRQRVARGERVLCTAPSNTAVDNLGQAMALAGARLRIVRLGHPARIDPALAQLTLDAQVDADGATRLAREWRDRARQLRRSAAGKRGPDARERWQEARALDRDAVREIANAERAIVERADVVLATCAGCDHPLIGETVFDCVVVDEATQAPDPLLLVALGRGQVAVLAGDPHQLGPVVTGGDAIEAALGSTIFERLARATAGADPSGGGAVMLEQQHRMHRDIMAFPSRTMYGERLRAAPAVAGHTLDDLAAAPDPLRPRSLWLIDTAGKDWVEQRAALDTALGSQRGSPDYEPGASLNNIPVFRFDPSTFNPGNAERTAAEARRLLSRGLPPTAIAIIAAYSAQARRLRELLRAERAAGLEIGTVDGFQGREKEAVIVDLVRSNDRGEIGFLADTRRMNVALTRARRFLLVIADSATLGDHPYYAQFLAYVDEIDAHGSAWSDDAPPV